MSDPWQPARVTMSAREQARAGLQRVQQARAELTRAQADVCRVIAAEGLRTLQTGEWRWQRCPSDVGRLMPVDDAACRALDVFDRLLLDLGWEDTLTLGESAPEGSRLPDWCWSVAFEREDDRDLAIYVYANREATAQACAVVLNVDTRDWLRTLLAQEIAELEHVLAKRAADLEKLRAKLAAAGG